MPRFRFLFFAGALLCVPFLAHAAAVLTPIIPTTGQCTCVGSAPDWGCVLQTIQIAINDIVAVSSIIITLYIAWAGFGFILSPTSAEGRSKARQRIVNAVLGLVIVLCAWLLIDSLMKVVYNSSASGTGVAQLGPWNAILSDSKGDYCIVKRTNIPPLPGLTTGANAGGGVSQPPTVTAGSGKSGLNIQAAVSYLEAHAHPLNDYTGLCAQYVRNALNAGGLTQFASGQGNAYQYGGPLTSAGFTAVYTGTYSASSGTAFAYQEGDVVVFQPVAGHPDGHITMYTGSGWVSDAVQANMASNQAAYQGGSFTVYRP